MPNITERVRVVLDVIVLVTVISIAVQIRDGVWASQIVDLNAQLSEAKLQTRLAYETLSKHCHEPSTPDHPHTCCREPGSPTAIPNNLTPDHNLPHTHPREYLSQPPPGLDGGKSSEAVPEGVPEVVFRRCRGSPLFNPFASLNLRLLKYAQVC